MKPTLQQIDERLAIMPEYLAYVATWRVRFAKHLDIFTSYGFLIIGADNEQCNVTFDQWLIINEHPWLIF